MSEQTIQLSEEAKRVLADLQSPEWVMAVMAKTIGKENQYTR